MRAVIKLQCLDKFTLFKQIDLNFRKAQEW